MLINNLLNYLILNDKKIKQFTLFIEFFLCTICKILKFNIASIVFFCLGGLCIIMINEFQKVTLKSLVEHF